MNYVSLVSFPAVFRMLAAELKPNNVAMSTSDTLALLVARHWLTQEGARFETKPFALTDEGGLQMRPAIRVEELVQVEKSQKKMLHTYRIAGVEGAAHKARWKMQKPAGGYTHLWLWHVAEVDPKLGNYAHHWRGEVSDIESWERDGADYALALKTLMDQDAPR